VGSIFWVGEADASGTAVLVGEGASGVEEGGIRVWAAVGVAVESFAGLPFESSVLVAMEFTSAVLVGEFEGDLVEGEVVAV